MPWFKYFQDNSREDEVELFKSILERSFSREKIDRLEEILNSATENFDWDEIIEEIKNGPAGETYKQDQKETSDSDLQVEPRPPKRKKVSWLKDVLRDKNVLPIIINEIKARSEYLTDLIIKLRQHSKQLEDPQTRQILLQHPKQLYAVCHEIAESSIKISRFISHDSLSINVLTFIGIKTEKIQSILDELFSIINMSTNICVEIKINEEFQDERVQPYLHYLLQHLSKLREIINWDTFKPPE